jgi:hypothetical protein
MVFALGVLVGVVMTVSAVALIWGAAASPRTASDLSSATLGMEVSSMAQLTITVAIRAPGFEPTLADFEHALAYAKRGRIVSDHGVGREVQDALMQVALAAPNSPKQLVDAAVDAFLRQLTDPRPWWQQPTWLEL